MLLKKTLSLAVLALCLPGASAARYIPPPLYDLVGYSDLIVVGSIARVEVSTFFLEVEEVLRGAEPAAVIEIEKFRDWTCAHRWEPYAPGQRVVAFLVREEGPYTLRSAGAEAEFPIDGDEAVVPVHAVLQPRLPTDDSLDARVPLDVVRSMITGFPACFEVDLIRGRLRRAERVEIVCDGDALVAYRSRSPLHARLVQMTLTLKERLDERR